MTTLPLRTLIKPFANAYWLVPGKVLAGEYPLTADVEESAVRLQNLLLTGVTTFINLTQDHERNSYAGSLPLTFGGRAVDMERWAIKDHDAPDSVEYMTLILDRIDAAVQTGGLVYIHCRAGIGRTGTVAGCYLVRQGRDGEQALTELNRRWQECGRAAQWPRVPETQTQAEFVRNYAAAIQLARNSDHRQASRAAMPVANAPDTVRATSAPHIQHDHRLDRYQGVLLGMAVAEAAVVEAVRLQVEPAEVKNLAGVAWQGDTAATYALVDSLLDRKGMQPQHQMQAYQHLIRGVRYRNVAADMPLADLFTKAVALWAWRRQALVGSHDPALLDAHTLARVAAPVLYFAHDANRAVREAAESSRTTLQSPIVLDACRLYAAVLLAAVSGASMPQLIAMQEGAAFAALNALTLKPEIQALRDGGWRHALNEPAGEDCISILAAALHAVFTTQDYVSAMGRAMRDATQPIRVAALTGALAGAVYGVKELPIVWRETLSGADELAVVARRLIMEAS